MSLAHAPDRCDYRSLSRDERTRESALTKMTPVGVHQSTARPWDRRDGRLLLELAELGQPAVMRRMIESVGDMRCGCPFTVSIPMGEPRHRRTRYDTHP